MAEKPKTWEDAPIPFIRNYGEAKAWAAGWNASREAEVRREKRASRKRRSVPE